MTPDEAVQVAQAAAKAANLAIAGHENAFHGPGSEAPLAPPPVPKKSIGLLKDPAGDWSSKRTESAVALVVGIAYPFVAAVLKSHGVDLTGIINSGVFVGALLGYSGALQGVSVAAERSI